VKRENAYLRSVLPPYRYAAWQRGERPGRPPKGQPAAVPQRSSHAPQQPSPRPVPRDEWPAWVRGVASRRKEGEAGVGDTLARLFNPLGAGDAYKAMRKMLGMPCNCERDQERLNTLYPYQT